MQNIGSDANEEWDECTGRFGIGARNDRGQILLEFAGKHRLVAMNTLFPHKKSRCTTWHSPNGEVHNQIDYILTPQCFKSSIIRPAQEHSQVQTSIVIMTLYYVT